jgi:hypothetical protein
MTDVNHTDSSLPQPEQLITFPHIVTKTIEFIAQNPADLEFLNDSSDFETAFKSYSYDQLDLKIAKIDGVEV